ncbi:IS3 family transposase [Cohnella laeviribosi]|nr:IS3 family transposase [Cohnella laeviribosi]
MLPTDPIRSLKESQERIEAYIRFYNEERIQLKLNKLTPVDYRSHLVS